MLGGCFLDERSTLTGPNPQARCLFCATTDGKRTREHIWKSSLRGRFPTVESLTFWQTGTELTGAIVTIRPVSQFDMTLNAICSACNAGWLYDLENDALPALDFFARGVGSMPIQKQLRDFAFWAITRALLGTHYSSGGRAPEPLFRTMYDQRSARQVPLGCIVSVASTAPVSMKAGTHQSARLDGEHYLGHVAVS